MLGGPRDGLRTGHRECQRWMRLSQWLRINGDIVEVPVGSVVVDTFLCPGLEQNVNSLLHPLAALLLGHAVTVELHRTVASAEAHGQPSPAENVQRGRFLG